MRNTRAFVVGVGRYFSEAWKIDGATRNAVAISNWLTANGVPPERVHLFVDVEALTADECLALAKTGVKPGETNHAAINTFWRARLPALADPGDRLFFFWSGHGMTDANGDRLFFCGDYSGELVSSVFNMSEFQANLRGPAFRTYATQMLFADACGTFANVETAATNLRPTNIAAVDQLAIFASREGEYTQMTDSSGAFTDALLGVLARFDCCWPEQDAFLDRLDAAAGSAALKPFRFDVKGNNREQRDRAFGHGAPNRIAHAGSAYAMLSRHSTGAIQRLHYERTLAGLGTGQASAVITLWDMIDDLCDRLDARDGAAPYGLVEFLARLATDSGLTVEGRAEISAWIRQNGEDRRREAEERIQADRGRRRLLLEVRHEAGRLSELVTCVRYADLTPVQGLGEARTPVESWDQLCAAVRERLENPRIAPPEVELELHFLADAPLFDLPFHQIRTRDGAAIGDQYVCILHSLRRARLGDATEEVGRWRSWGQALSAMSLADLAVHPLQPHPPLPSSGLCYADFVMTRQAVREAGKQRLHKLVQLGAPFICWLHAGETAASVPDAVHAIQNEAGALSGLPGVLLARRMGECPVAAEVSMLWDERPFRPFLMTQGAVKWQDGESSAATVADTTN